MASVPLSLMTMQADGTAVTGTTAGSVLAAQAKFTAPQNLLNNIGQTMRIRAGGRISNIVTTPGTVTFTVRFGATTVASSGALQLNAVAKTNVTWRLDWDMTLRVSGSSAQFMHTGMWTSESVVGSAVPGSGGSGSLLLPASAPAVGTAFDATASQQIDLFAVFSLTGNSVQAHQYTLELMSA